MFMLHKCDKFKIMQTKQGYTFAEQNKMGFSCLNRNVPSHNCTIFTCRKCNKRHHGLSHADNFSHGQAYKQRALSSRASTSVCISWADAVTCFALKTQPCNEVLANAIVHVQNTFRQYVPCQALPFNASGTLSQKDVSEGEKNQRIAHSRYHWSKHG